MATSCVVRYFLFVTWLNMLYIYSVNIHTMIIYVVPIIIVLCGKTQLIMKRNHKLNVYCQTGFDNS